MAKKQTIESDCKRPNVDGLGNRRPLAGDYILICERSQGIGRGAGSLLVRVKEPNDFRSQKRWRSYSLEKVRSWEKRRVVEGFELMMQAVPIWHRCQAFRWREVGNTKVDDLDGTAIRRPHEIGWLDISMNDAMEVHCKNKSVKGDL